MEANTRAFQLPHGSSCPVLVGAQGSSASRVWCHLLCPHPDCDCYAGGTEGNACRKDPRVGMCVCKPNFQGTHCDQCAPGHYGPSCQREYLVGSVPRLP